ncbi:amidase signature domain-containing protein [Jimgerdemannia flammicorona]|uniref:Amidase signature domain-containing protein n=1 Tax=Jimgerdemannia flammicorona TaxID=994334 RepID=A0A433D5D0_9FUNG|nr:amidase signature domain-containing protein [Jimgerdemannia flammicorona]
MVFGYLTFRKARKSKLSQRNAAITSLSSELPSTLDFDTTHHEIVAAPVSEILRRVHEARTWTSRQIITAFAKQALIAHAETNCLTEVFASQAISHAAELDLEMGRRDEPVGPLHGVPVSLKDTFNVFGVDSTLGYSGWVGRPAGKDSVIVSLLKKAGAVPYVKTNIPQTLLSFESWNPVG